MMLVSRKCISVHVPNNTLISGDTLTMYARRLIDSGGGLAQSWTEADTAVNLETICQYTMNNGAILDTLNFDDTSETDVFYTWDVSSGVQADIDDGNTYFTVQLEKNPMNRQPVTAPIEIA